MSPIKKLPIKVRYARGKFRHLSSPLLWFPLGIVCLLGVFVWELSVNPELLEIGSDEFPGENGKIAGEDLSAAELSAIAAEIDSSEFLLKELESNEAVSQGTVLIPKAVLDRYIDENGRTLTLLEKTKQELSSIYEKTGSAGNTGNFIVENPASPLNLGTNPELGQYSLGTSNNRLSNPTPFLPSSFNVLSPENRQKNSKDRLSPLQAAMQNYLDSGNSSESVENDYRPTNNDNSELYQTQEDLTGDSSNFPRDNSQLPGGLPNNQNYSNPGVRVNSGDRPYYIDRSGGYGNTRQQNQPYYTNSYGSPTIDTPENQPYYSDIYGSGSGQTQPTQINVPDLVPVLPNNSNLPSNPYSRTGVPYSGNSPYSANQGYPQFQQNQLNNGANYDGGNNGATQQPQPYNNFRSSPFSNQFGQQNNPFKSRQ